MLEFLNTSESKLNIVTMSPSSDTRIPSDGELGRKWLYLKKDNTMALNQQYYNRKAVILVLAGLS